MKQGLRLLLLAPVGGILSVGLVSPRQWQERSRKKKSKQVPKGTDNVVLTALNFAMATRSSMESIGQKRQ
jgi:hypothetical protein